MLLFVNLAHWKNQVFAAITFPCQMESNGCTHMPNLRNISQDMNTQMRHFLDQLKKFALTLVQNVFSSLFWLLSFFVSWKAITKGSKF